jgi:tetratricopeptide (TPR) repeat protein
MSHFRRVILLGAIAAAVLVAGPKAPRLIAEPTGSAAWAASSPATAGSAGFGHFLAGRHAQQIRDHNAAADFFANVLSRDPDNIDLMQQSFIAMASGGRLDEAAVVGRKLEERSASSDTVSLILAMQDLKAKQVGAALNRLAAMSPTGLNQFTVPLVKAWVELESGRLDDALATLAPLEKVRGVQSLYYLHVGLLNELGRRTAEAEAAYDKALEDPQRLSFRVVEIVANYYLRQNQPERAQAVYGAFRSVYPDNPLLPLLVQANARGNVAPIIGSARAGLAEALFNLASVLYQEDARDMAMVYTRLALDLRPEFPAVQVLLGDLMSADRHYADAIAVYRQVDQASPFGWQARLALAETLNKSKRTDEAVELLKAMAAERPESVDAPMLLGDILRGAERFQEAAQAYDEAVARVGELRPEHWSLLYYRGIAHERSKQWERAETDFLKALEFEPDQPYVLNYLAYSWVDQGENYDRALTMLHKAVEQRPDDGYIVDSLGWVYYRLGRYDLAVEQLERAIELVPQDPVINDHLGDAYWRVGRRNEARFQWRRALNLKPEADQIAPIESKLKDGLPATPSGS